MNKNSKYVKENRIFKVTTENESQQSREISNSVATNKKIIYFLLIGLILLGVGFRLFSLNKDFSAEETDYIKPALALIQTGHIYFYNSEQIPRIAGLFHPPMYNFLLALIFKFIISEISARLLNVIFSFLIVILIFLFCYKLNLEHGKIIGLFASALFLINYYSLSSSILIDIDVLSAFFVLGFVLSLTLLITTKKNNYLYLVGLFFFFALWNRWIIAIINFVFLGAYLLINTEIRKYFKKYVLSIIISSLAFLLIWSIYSFIIEPGTFLEFIVHNVSMGEEQFTNIPLYLASFALNLVQLIRLVTFPVILLFILAVIFLIRKKNPAIRILIISSLSTLFFFLLVARPAFGYPRYFFSALPIMMILISIFIYNYLKEKFNLKELVIVLLAFTSSLILLLVLNPQSTIYMSNGLIKATNLPDFIFNIFCSMPIIFVLFIKPGNRLKILVTILLILSLSYSLYFDSKYVTYDSQVKEAGEYLKNHTNENEIVMCPKAIGYYTERKFYNNDNNKPALNEISLEYIKLYLTKSYENRAMNDPFFWPKGIYSGLYGEVEKEKLNQVSYVVKYYLIENKTPEEIIGDYYIYNLKV